MRAAPTSPSLDPRPPTHPPAPPDAGLKAGHTLAELSPGAEQQPWVQSQTTFARLHREEDGSWAVRAVKQKIWVEGVSYELQVGGWVVGRVLEGVGGTVDGWVGGWVGGWVCA